MRPSLFATLMVFSLMAYSYSALDALAEEPVNGMDKVQPQPLQLANGETIRVLVLPRAEILHLDTSQPGNTFLKIKNRFGLEETVTVLPGTTLTRDEKDILAGDLKIGDIVDIEYNMNFQSMERTAVSIKVLPEQRAEHLDTQIPSTTHQERTQQNPMGSMKRYYFENIDNLHCAQVHEGMTPAEVRQLCKGQPYTPFETVRNGFSFALDESHRNMFIIPNWMPNPAWILDFFVAEDEFFYVRYDDANRVALVMRYPIASKPAQSVKVISGQKNHITAPQ